MAMLANPQSLDAKMLQSLGLGGAGGASAAAALDPKMFGLPGFPGLDPKSLGLTDPKMMAALGMGTSAMDSKNNQAMALQIQQQLAMMGMAGMDAKTLQALGLGGLDAQTLAALTGVPGMGHDLKQQQLMQQQQDLQAKALAQMMGAVDPKLLGLGGPTAGMPGIGGMNDEQAKKVAAAMGITLPPRTEDKRKAPTPKSESAFPRSSRTPVTQLPAQTVEPPSTPKSSTSVDRKVEEASTERPASTSGSIDPAKTMAEGSAEAANPIDPVEPATTEETETPVVVENVSAETPKEDIQSTEVTTPAETPSEPAGEVSSAKPESSKEEVEEIENIPNGETDIPTPTSHTVPTSLPTPLTTTTTSSTKDPMISSLPRPNSIPRSMSSFTPPISMPSTSLPIDVSQFAAAGIDSATMKALGSLGAMDPKTLKANGLDPVTLKSLGLGGPATPKQHSMPGLPPGLAPGFSGGANRMPGMESFDNETLKLLASGDPAAMQKLMTNPATAMMAGLDPRMMGLDPQTMAALMGQADPSKMSLSSVAAMNHTNKQMEQAVLKQLGVDTQTLQAMQQQQLQQQQLAQMGMLGLGSMDPKMLQMMGMPGLDPKYMQGIPGK